MQDPSSQPLLTSDPQDDWSNIISREERKKRQNRLNQRARRLRNEQLKVQSVSSNKRPYRVERWRAKTVISHVPSSKFLYGCEASSLDTPDHPNRRILRSNPAFSESMEQISDKMQLPIQLPGIDLEKTLLLSIHFPLSSDHLLINLIHYNVFRALTANKSLLASRSVLIKPSDQGLLPLLPSFTNLCDGLTIIEPHESLELPPLLSPTISQRTIPHSSWINMFPFPRFRENLIQFEGIFDASDLCNDLFGDLFTSQVFSPDSNGSSTSPSGEADGNVEIDDDDSVVSHRRGLIVWGESWNKDCWEVTPGFVKKWAWLLDGCNDMIESGNQWRRKRGEEPLMPLNVNVEPGI